ncbi:MAG: hypothetical protein JJT81_20495 [Rubellimicrobium sp.]|nr:hypothetical protein [Rubellimicrobium sp.]
MAERSFGRTVGSLALALLNATLILVALSLWLAWGAIRGAERVSDQLADAAETVLPLRSEIVTLTEEIAAARAVLAQRASEGDSGAVALEARLAGVEARLAELTAAVTELGIDPEALIDRAVSSSFEGLGEAVARVLSSLREAS